MGGAFLSKPITDKKTQKYQHRKIRVTTCEMQGWRKHMEDAMIFHRISQQIFLFAVFDGHGGVEVAQFCAKQYSEVLQRNQSFKKGDYASALKESFQQMDKILDSEEGEKILKNISIENGLQPFENSKVADSVGCTANVSLLVGKKMYIANVGDSRAVLCRRGEAVQLSYDHKPENPLQLQRIVSAGFKVQNGRINNHLNLSRCLGDLYYKRNDKLSYDRQAITCHPDLRIIELDKGDDFLLIGCDGIWERFEKNSQQLITLVREERIKGLSPQQVLEEMLQGFLAQNPTKQHLGCDNMSVILIQLNKNCF